MKTDAINQVLYDKYMNIWDTLVRSTCFKKEKVIEDFIESLGYNFSINEPDQFPEILRNIADFIESE